MKMSVSMRRSATLPAVTRRSSGIGLGAERSSQRGVGSGVIGQIRIERPANHFCHRHTLRSAQGVDAATLFLSEIDLSSSRRHTARVYSMVRTLAAVVGARCAVWCDARRPGNLLQ